MSIWWVTNWIFKVQRIVYIYVKHFSSVHRNEINSTKLTVWPHHVQKSGFLTKKLTKPIKSAVLRSSFAIWNEKEFRVQQDQCQTSSKDVSLKYDFLAQSNHVSWYSNVHLIPQILCFKRQFSIGYSPKSNIKQARRAESFGSAR